MKRYSLYFLWYWNPKYAYNEKFDQLVGERPSSGKNKDKEYKIVYNTRIYLGIGVRFIGQHSLDTFINTLWNVWTHLAKN